MIHFPRAIVGFLLLALQYAVFFLPFLEPVEGHSRNRLPHAPLKWRLHKTENFDFFYTESSAQLLPWLAAEAEKAGEKLRTLYGLDREEEFQQRQAITILVYPSMADLRETRVLSGAARPDSRGFSEPLQERIAIPGDDSRQAMEELIVHELAHLLARRAMGQAGLRGLRNSLPLWFLEGLAESATDQWAVWDRAILRDALMFWSFPHLGDLGSFRRLRQPFLGYAVGHATIELMLEQYGDDILMRVLSNLRLQGRHPDLAEAFFGATRHQLWELDEALRRRLLVKNAALFSAPESGPPTSTPWAEGGSGAHIGAVISPAGELLASITSMDGRPTLAIHRLRDGAPFQRASHRFRKVDAFVTNGRPLSWTPDGFQILFFATVNGDLRLCFYDLARKRITRALDVGLQSASSPSVHPDGRQVAMAGFLNGQSDVFIYDEKTGTLEQITDDTAVDGEPSWSPSGRELVYTSERNQHPQLLLLTLTERKTRPLLNARSTFFQATWSKAGILAVWDRSGVADIYRVDPKTLTATRLTKTFTQTAWPTQGPDGRVFFSQLERGRFRVRSVRPALRMSSLERPSEEISLSAARMARPATGEALSELSGEKVRASLRLHNLGYRLGWAEDQRFLFSAFLSLSDRPAEHQFQVRFSSDAYLEGFSGSYANLRRRLTLGVTAGHQRRWVRFQGAKQKYSEQWGSAFAVYPLSRTTRIESDVTVKRWKSSGNYGIYGSRSQKRLAVSARFLNDRVHMGALGPRSGWELRMEATGSIPLDGLLSQSSLELEQRFYVPLLRRTVAAIRMAAGSSMGADPLYFSLGGDRSLRGYGLEAFTGENYLLGNVELRFPIIDHLAVRSWLRTGGVRGAVFADMGATFEQWSRFDPWKSKPRFQLEDLKASLGARAAVRVGSLDFRLTLAFRTNLDTIDDNVALTFSVGRGVVF